MNTLLEYRRKRRFTETPEPPPVTKSKPPGHQFVIQKHDATRLHYDFRLEIDGVLKSWAVPKGPSLNPADKRLAMETEDHPLEYANFEGVIPEGHYGAGPVIVWDRGTFTTEGALPAIQQYQNGEIKFVLRGQKLQGGFVLVRLRRAGDKGKPWLLIKHRDAAADPQWKVEAHDGSVLSDRKLKEIEEGLPRLAQTRPGGSAAFGTTDLPAKRDGGLRHPPAGTGLLTSRSETEKELFHGGADNIGLKIDGKHLQLSNLNKVYFPEDGYTKRDLLAYYYKIAPYILPFLKDRPLVLRRYPNGITGKSFFQKDAGNAIPEWMETVTIHSEHEARDVRYFLANGLAALLYLTNLGCIDHNPWSSRRDKLDHPDYVFFDLDPSEGTNFAAVVEVAQAVHQKLTELGLKVFLKPSGATGFHIYAPLKRKYTFEQVRNFAETVARRVAAEKPGRVTEQRIIRQRPRGTVMIDAYQNAPGRPLAAPYAVRAFAHARVSAPIAARELRQGLDPNRLNIKSIWGRIDRYGDLWADFWKTRQTIGKALKRLQAR